MKRTLSAFLLCLLFLAPPLRNAPAQESGMAGTETGPVYAAGPEYRTTRPKMPTADPRRQAPPSCDDRLACTEDRWENVQGIFRCTHTIKPGFCVIGGACYARGQVNPANPCQECRDDWGQGYKNRWGFDNSNPCSDSDPCTCNDRCVSGNCVSVRYTCDDGNPCTMDICNGDGTCAHRRSTSAGCP